MSILAIDYGDKHLGFAVGFKNGVSSPVGIEVYSDNTEAIRYIQQYIREYRVEEVIIGLPLKKGKETKQTKKTRAFGSLVKKTINVPVRYVNETLTSHDAVTAMIQAGVPKEKRKQMEHAFAAKEILDAQEQK